MAIGFRRPRAATKNEKMLEIVMFLDRYWSVRVGG